MMDIEIAKIRTDLFGWFDTRNEFPLSMNDLMESDIEGFYIDTNNLFYISVYESRLNKGFYHIDVISKLEKSQTKRPVIAEAVPFYIECFIDNYSGNVAINSKGWVWKLVEKQCREREDKVNVSVGEVIKKSNKTIDGEVVYFLSAGDFIKIGKATGSPYSRIAALKTGCPYPISLIGYIGGGIKEEFELHKRFSKYRAHGEWFYNMGELKDFIEHEIKK